MTESSQDRPDLKLAAVCGLFCPACAVYIATREDPQRLALIAGRWGVSVEEAKCDGCRSPRRFVYCRTCKMGSCATDKGVDFCGECDEYPCEDLKGFKEEMPHRIELWSDLDRIEEVGYEQWFDEKLDFYACPKCGVINSAYDLACRNCGETPSCQYVGLHRDAVMAHLAKLNEQS